VPTFSCLSKRRIQLNHYISRNSRGKPLRFETSYSTLVAAGGVKYQRRLHLQQLLPVTLPKIDDQSSQNCRWIISRLATALRQERNRGRCGHWTYSLNRHVALLQAYRGERLLLENLGD